MARAWDDSSGFLEQFLPRRRGFVSNLYCYSIRGGDWLKEKHLEPTRDLDEVLDRVKQECENRISDPDFYKSDMVDDCQQLLNEIDSELSIKFATHILWREGLTPEAKDQLKSNTKQTFVHSAMEAKEPSDAQINYLNVLGYRGDKPQSMKEASDLITAYKKK